MSFANLTWAQQALLGYMEGQSEERWCAGWLSDLETALLGDGAYEWLVEQAGGTFMHDPSAELINGRPLTFRHCTLTQLREARR